MLRLIGAKEMKQSTEYSMVSFFSGEILHCQRQRHMFSPDFLIFQGENSVETYVAHVNIITF